MKEYLSNWWLWLFVILIVFIIIWVYVRITGNGRRTTTISSTTATENNMCVRQYPRANRDAMPLIETIDTAEDVTIIDMTPELPEHILSDRDETPKRQSKGEAECKRVIEEMYGVPFDVQVRPDFLINDLTGERMELDLSELKHLKIAVEYNGIQHYKYTPHFHKNIQAFKDQVYRDNLKINLCDKEGVYLITVPYNVPIHKIKEYISYYRPEAVAAREGAHKIRE